MAMAVLSAAVVVLITIILALFLRKWRKLGNDVKGLPKGSVGLPWVGETMEFMSYFSTSDPEPFVNNRVAKYGKVFKSHLFGKPTIISADAEFNKFVMQNDKRLFNMGYPTSFAEILGTYDMLMVNGELHKKMRGYAMTFLTSKKLQDYLLNDIDSYVLLALSTWKGRVVNVQDEAKAYTFRVVAKQLISFGPGEESDSLMKEYYQLFDGIFSLPLKIPGSTYAKAVQARGRILKRLTQVIDSRKSLEKDDHKDLLATVFSTEMRPEDRMSNEQIMDYFLGLLSAGHVSTATAVLFAIAFLTDSPKALNQLREENLAIKRNQKGERLSWEAYKNSMPFTLDVIYETLRLTNVSHGLYRTAIEDIQYQGYTIPKGWTVLAYARAVHLDGDIYEDPFAFNPWRWKTMSPTMNNFMVFGGGPRQCAGYELAKLEIAMFLHHLVTKFSWKPVEQDKMVYFPTVRMIKGLPIVVEDLINAAD
ncbi:hypothetical protein O6H91_07G027600 [Diphasiastrum complanatum]|uniref:Uncharacterized protein n=3 Tax=Diphasiastrum complanatum TaxID=34168 RepID=A0ACC2D491_DIPCM|nr:hypothetical protein O6H91_07G027100 [Diphasiastrum complanatum]KAJ7548792.1 hypothetical protein O6H91_07G027400 [Diphasiastrum complanatum]KAJ7548794.1 hypothetical protein O6H91_07G027600 [Diphasiastrum complanatum]